MIDAGVGRPGAGKSYLAAELIKQALDKGRSVVTDIPLTIENDLIFKWNSELITSIKYKGVTDDAQIEEAFNAELDALYPKGALYVLDECWKYMQGGQKIDSLPRQQLFFFKKHRHRLNELGLSDDIFLVTQDLSDINSTVRSMVETTILCVKPSDIGLKNVSVRYYMSGAIKGVKPIDKFVVRTETVKIKPEIYNLYKSHTQSNNLGGEIVEGSAVESSFFKSLKFKFMIFGVVSSLLVIAFSSYHLATKTVPKYTTKLSLPAGSLSSSPSSPLSVKPVAQVSPPLPPQPVDSLRWRVLAVLKKGGNTKIYLADASGRLRRASLSDCTSDDFGQYFCLIDGQKVSPWSGSTAQGGFLSSGLDTTKNTLHIKP